MTFVKSVTMVTRRWATRFPLSVVDPLWTHLIPGFSGNHGLSMVAERSKLLRSKSSYSLSGASDFCATATPPGSTRQLDASRIDTKIVAMPNALCRSPRFTVIMSHPSLCGWIEGSQIPYAGRCWDLPKRKYREGTTNRFSKVDVTNP